jgi:hypothetical protein
MEYLIFFLLVGAVWGLLAAANASDEFYNNVYYSAAEMLERAKNYKPTEVSISTVENDNDQD